MCTDGQFVSLESVRFPGSRVGILPDGDPKDPDKTGTGLHGQFVPTVVGEWTDFVLPRVHKERVTPVILCALAAPCSV